MKIYQRYELLARMGIIAQSDGDIVVVNGTNLPKQFLELDNHYSAKNTPNYIICGAYQDINIWNIHTKEKIEVNLKYPKNDCKVSKIMYIKASNYLVVGYTNGSIVVWDLKTMESIVSFDGHTAAITVLLYDHELMNLVISGSQDNDIICWDLINQIGLYRLKGHTGPITSLKLLKMDDTNNPILISSSKDTFIKLWDTSLQHCFATLVGHNHEVWDFVLFDSYSRLMSFSSDNELRIWKLTQSNKNNTNLTKRLNPEHTTDKVIPLECEFVGSIQSKTSKRTIVTKVIANFILQLVSDSKLYIYKILDDDAKQQILNKRIKKSKNSLNEDQIELTLSDEFKLVTIIKMRGKVKNFALLRTPIKPISNIDNNNHTNVKNYMMAILFQDNIIEINYLTIYVDGSTTKIDLTLQSDISRFGHRHEITHVTIDGYNNSFMSLSKDSIKLWDFHQNQLIKTVLDNETIGGFTSCLFVPGNRFIITAFVNGEIRIYNLVDSSLVECIVTMDITNNDSTNYNIGLSMIPNKKGVVSYNKSSSVENVYEVKFWDFELIDGDINKLSLTHKRTLQVADAILDVQFSPNLKFVLVTLLDSTVKIFFLDTLKFYLTLYGHKLPVTSVDVSSDNMLVVTSSIDKNIKLWGLDFGDCHKSLFAHDQSVTCVKFVPKTHYFFSCSKDGKLRYWDGDTYDLLLTFDEHCGSLLWLDISLCGKKVVTCGSDKTISVWKKTEEQFVLEEEHERIYEMDMEKTVVADTNSLTTSGEIGKTTIETVKETEQLLEQIDSCIKLELMHKSVNTQLRDKILSTLRTIKQNQIEQCLSLLPNSYVITFLKYLIGWLELNILDIELCSRCILYLFKIHYSFLLNKIPMEKIKETVQQRIHSLRDLVGFNMAALKYMEYQKYGCGGSAFNTRIIDEVRRKKSLKKKKSILNVVV